MAIMTMHGDHGNACSGFGNVLHGVDHCMHCYETIKLT